MTISCCLDGDSIGILNNATPANTPSSNNDHPTVVHGPLTRKAEDQVGSGWRMKYGARTSHTLMAYNELKHIFCTSMLAHLYQAYYRDEEPALFMGCKV